MLSPRRYGNGDVAHGEEFARRICEAQLVEPHVEGDRPLDSADLRVHAFAGERSGGLSGEPVLGWAGLQGAEGGDDENDDAKRDLCEDFGDSAQPRHGQNACPRLT